MCIVSKWARTRNTQYLQFLQASAQSLFAFLIVQYMKVEASGDYYNAWRSEEGAANEKWMIYLQFALWYNTRVWFFLCKKKKPSALTKATIAPITQLSCHQSFNRQTEFKNRKKRVAKQQLQYKRVADEVQVPTFEGDEDAGCGQWLIDHWVPESEGGQCQEGVDRPQTVQLHGGPTSSTTQGVLFKKKKKVSAGTKKKKITWEEKMLCRRREYNLPQLLWFINLCDVSNLWLPRAPSHCEFWWRRCGDYTPDLGELHRTDECGWRGAKLLETCAHFHLVKNCVCFSERVPVWQTDGKRSVSSTPLHAPKTHSSFMTL